jgi:CheY-like chemotaxis protein
MHMSRMITGEPFDRSADTVSGESGHARSKRQAPELTSKLRVRSVIMPEAIYQASGIKIMGKRIKSLIFTTDVALITNCNAQAVMCVYPFTPTLTITQAILDVAPVPVLVGVGGGLTTGPRMVNLALYAELIGAYGAVVNAPISLDMISELDEVLDIPLIATVISDRDDYAAKVKAGAQILNVSGGRGTVQLVRRIREDLGPDLPIIATGGNQEETILATVEAGANAITYTPPTSAEIFREVMEKYRQR